MSASVRDQMIRAVDDADGAGSRLFRVRSCTVASFESPAELVHILTRTTVGLSAYTMCTEDDDDSRRRAEGFYVRLDDDATGLLRARCKLVHGDFHQLLGEGRWEKRAVTKNTVRTDIWRKRDDDGVQKHTEE